jgi:ABC-2 type transport system permease protein
MPQMVYPYLPAVATGMADNDYLVKALDDFNRNTGDTLKTLMPGAAAIDFDDTGFVAVPVLLTVPEKVWLKSGKLVTDSLAPVFDSATGDLKRDSFVVAIALSRNVGQKEQRIVICGDADFMSSYRGGGGFLSPVIYSWLDYGKYPVFTNPKEPTDNLLRISKRDSVLQLILFVWILPLLVLIAGGVVLIRRKRK